MSTIKDFENAPVGATATNEYGLRAMKLNYEGRWAVRSGATWISDDMERFGYTLDQPAPTTAREALALAWELSDPMKEGHDVPIGTECIAKVRDGEFLTYRSRKPFDGVRRPGWAEARTLDPLPEPEPDWLDAPAVIARLESWSPCAGPQVFTRHDYYDATSIWRYNSSDSYHWSDLKNVTPLYPEEG